jgi:hypothetical protein
MDGKERKLEGEQGDALEAVWSGSHSAARRERMYCLHELEDDDRQLE